MTRYFGVGSVNLFDESSAHALIQFANDFPWHSIEDFDQDFIDNGRLFILKLGYFTYIRSRYRLKHSYRECWGIIYRDDFTRGT